MKKLTKHGEFTWDLRELENVNTAIKYDGDMPNILLQNKMKTGVMSSDWAKTYQNAHKKLQGYILSKKHYRKGEKQEQSYLVWIPCTELTFSAA